MAQTRLGVLDGLRGIAVLLVLWFHVWEISWLPAPWHWMQFVPETGFIGVDLFFFISGFVIVYPFVKAAANRDPAPAWGHFAYRRAIKIVPSYVLSIAVAIAIGYAHFASPWQAVQQIGSHLLFIHTWWQSTYGSINGVLWTLAVEVEFYAIFPLLWLAFRRAPFLTATGMVVAAQIYRTYAASCCWSTSMGLLVENLPGYLDIFAFGMIAAYLYVRWRERAQAPAPQRWALLASLGGFVLIVLLMQNLWAMRAADQWDVAWAIHLRSLLGLAFALAALGALLAHVRWQQILANRMLLFFGLVSYNLYLYHQMLARELLAWHVLSYQGSDPKFDPHWQLQYTLLAFALTIAQAALFTYAFERPLLRLPLAFWRQLWSRARPKRALTGM